MKLRNKKTGETGYYLHTHRDHKTGVLRVAVLKDGVPFSEFKPYEPIYDYDSLVKINEEWEDAPEEPKEYWYIDPEGTIIGEPDDEAPYDNYRKQIGNYFDTREEAEKAVEKLKAVKRLKDKGFKVKGWKFTPDMKQIEGNYVKIEAEIPQILINEKDLDFLFGGEE